ncbi:aryl-alcohol dehydrogenase [Marmoricola sp. URHA0025 HA25]
MKTLAAVSTHAEKPFVIEELDLDEPRPDELLVRVEAVGLCHTDLALRAMWPEGVPIVLGHEGAGVVEAVGDRVTDVRPGDTVLLSFASCGSCGPCAEGAPAYCSRFQEANVSGGRLDGSPTLGGSDGQVSGAFFGQSSFARYALSSRRNAVVIDPDIDLTQVAAFGCGIQTGAGAVVNVLQPPPNGRLVVFGLGGVGMAAVMAGAIRGVETIVGVDLSASRRETALEVGATHVIDGARPDVLDAVRDVTGGGATHAVDTTAIPAVIRAAAQALASRGTLVVVGLGADVTLDVPDLIGGGKTVRGTIEGDADPQSFIPRLVEWYREGRLPMERIVTTFPFTDIDRAVAGMRDGSAVKPVLVFGD